jgi:acyl-CoA synthetase (AMP-forming)/AMP-acid ligase II
MPGATTWNELLMRHWLGSAQPAVMTVDDVWTGDELVRRAAGAAEWLAAMGFEPGTGVPALIEGSATAVALVTGGALSRRPVAPLGTRLRPAELAAATRNLSSAGLVTTPGLIDLANEVAALAGTQVCLLDAPPPEAAIPDGHADPDDLVVIVHTSGTTGAPKPVLMHQREMVERVGIYEATMPIGPGHRYCSASPFHHTAAVTMVFTVLGLGAGLIPQAGFSIEGWRTAGRLGVTHALLVPTMIDLLLEAGALADAQPLVLQYGAAPMDPGTLVEALAVLPDVEFLQIFGQTEVSPITALTPSDHRLGLSSRPDILATVGRAVPGVELRVEHPDAEGIGELVLRAPHAFVHDADGWRRTGDLGRVDCDGYVSLQGRVHDRIVRGGENIYPLEVERALATCPGVRDVAVVGVPDRRWGEIVKAFVVPTHSAAPPTLDQLQRHGGALLARFKLPTKLEIVDELPRNANGKLLRHQLVGRGPWTVPTRGGESVLDLPKETK